MTLRLTPEQYAALQKRRAKAPAAAPAKAPEHAKADKHPLMLRDQIVAQGEPEPYREFTFHQSRGWRLDLAWPDRRLAIEVDGGVHRIKGRFAADIEKHNALYFAGWRHLRVTPRMVETGEALDLVLRALRMVTA